MNESTFSQKLLLTNTQSSKICKASANGLSANIKFSKARLSKMIHLGGDFLLMISLSHLERRVQ